MSTLALPSRWRVCAFGICGSWRTLCGHQDMNLAKLPASCFPKTDPTDKLAGLRQKALKKKVLLRMHHSGLHLLFALCDRSSAHFLSWKLLNFSLLGPLRYSMCCATCALHIWLCNLWQVRVSPTEMAKDGEGKDSKEKPGGDKKLDMVRWIAAYMNFAIAADAAEVWPYCSAMAHLKVCLQVAGSHSSLVSLLCVGRLSVRALQYKRKGLAAAMRQQ
jgi:hypothetical protein